MRVHPEEADFFQWLLQLGNNDLPIKSDQPFQGCIRIPDQCVTESVVTSVFGDQFSKYTFADRVILSPTILNHCN